MTQYPADRDAISQTLRVAHLLAGSVRRVDDKLRGSVQLLGVANESPLWTKTYDRPLNAVFATESDITKAVAGQLHAKLSPNEKRMIDSLPNP